MNNRSGCQGRDQVTGYDQRVPDVFDHRCACRLGVIGMTLRGGGGVESAGGVGSEAPLLPLAQAVAFATRMSKSKHEDQPDGGGADQHPATEPLVGDRAIESPDENLLERGGACCADL